MTNAKCPVCYSDKFQIIGKPIINAIAGKILKTEYYVVRCYKCSAYFVSPEISFTEDEWKQLYNSEYFGLQTAWLLKKRRNELQKRIDELQKKISNKNVSFLDIGCGEGNALILAEKKGWNVTGVDITDNRVDAAKKENIKFCEGALLTLSLPSNQFDIVFMDSVLEHVTNPMDYLHEINRILKKEGILYIGVPNEDALQNDVKKIIYNLTGKKEIASQIKPFDTPYHIVGFNKKSLQFAFGKTGFEILELRNLGRKFEFLGIKPGTRGFYIGLFLLPFEFLGMITRRDVYYEAILRKKNG